MNSNNDRLGLKALDDLLEQERTAVLEGQFEKVSSLLEKKERLINDLGPKNSLDAARVAEFRKKMIRNKLLLESSAEGIRTVSSRIEEFTKIRSGLDVYDATGNMRRFGSRQQSRLEKKA